MSLMFSWRRERKHNLQFSNHCPDGRSEPLIMSTKNWIICHTLLTHLIISPLENDWAGSTLHRHNPRKIIYALIKCGKSLNPLSWFRCRQKQSKILSLMFRMSKILLSETPVFIVRFTQVITFCIEGSFMCKIAHYIYFTCRRRNSQGSQSYWPR